MMVSAILHLALLVGACSTLAAQAPVPLWRVAPEVRAGTGDGPGALSTVSDVTMGRDGSVYVSQPQENVVKVYDARGRYLRSIGREGSGPGEFDRPSSLGWRGDTLWVVDTPQTRISLFLPNGRFVRSISFSRAAPLTDGRHHIPGSLLADGSVLGMWQTPLSLIAGTPPVSVPMVRFTARGEPIALLARDEHRNAFGVIAEGTSRTYFPQRFTDTPLTAVSPDGSAVVMVRRNAATRSDSTVFSVQRFHHSGRVTLSRNYRYRPLPLTREMVERAEDEHVGALGETRIRTPEASVLRRQIRESLYRPRFLPPVTRLVLGRDGTIWLRREDLGRDMAWWHVLDGRGRIIARAWVPAGVRLVYADRTQIWAVELDEFDVPTLVKYRIFPGG
jgi:hypothetical protein